MSILISSIGVPAFRPIYSSVRSMALRRSSLGAALGSGTLPVIGATSWGEVPQGG